MPKNLKLVVAYFFMIIALGLITAGMCFYGESLFSSSIEGQTRSPVSENPELLFHLLLALVIIIAVAKGFGRFFTAFNQPAVMGEVVAGIALGPSLLGLLSPELLQFIMPTQLAPILGMFAQIGIVIFMFLVGVDLDTKLLKKKGHAAIAISHASILAPMLLGSIVALWLYPRFSPSNISFTVFAVFMGVALSITAFPVLARILSDLKIANTPMAALTLTCAAVDDVTAWCLLAFAIGLAQGNLLAVVSTVLWSVLFLVVMAKFAPLILNRIGQKIDSARTEQVATTAIVIAVLAAALCTQSIGIHALFGPFMLGTLIPKESQLAQKVTSRLEPLTVALLLPIFFAFTGMRTQIGLVNSFDQWMWCLLLVLVASMAKIGGASIAAKLNGIHWRDSLAIGVLMNTRGLMELIVLNIGLELKILTPTLFTVMVIMAVATTLMTSPLFGFVTKKRPWTSAAMKGLDKALS